MKGDPVLWPSKDYKKTKEGLYKKDKWQPSAHVRDIADTPHNTSEQTRQI